jgi:hypothetical protein
LHTCLSRRFSGKPSPRFSVGIAIHHLPSDYFPFLLIRICTKKLFWLYAHLALMTPLGTLASDFLPILNDYYTEITALSSDIISYFFHYHFLKAVKDINSILPKFP